MLQITEFAFLAVTLVNCLARPGACGGANTALLADKIVRHGLRFGLNAASDGTFAHILSYGVFFP